MSRKWMAGTMGLMAACLLVAAASAPAGDEEPKIKAKPLSKWLSQLNSDNKGLQLRAMRALSEAKEDLRPAIIEKIIPLLKAERENLRAPAAQVLGNYGPAARAAIPHLLPLLKGTQFERNRSAAAKSLGQILEDAEPGEEVEEVAKALTAKFTSDYDQYGDVRREAVRAIGMIGPAAKSVIPQLAKGLTDFKERSPDHTLVRQQAAWTCGRMGPLAKEHMDRLISMNHQEGHHLTEIVWAIGEIGAIHDNVVPNVLDKLEKTMGMSGHWENFIFTSVEALGKFGPKSKGATDFLALLLKKDSLEVRSVIATLNALGAIGPDAKGALETVQRFTDVKNLKSRAFRNAEDEQKTAVVEAAEAAVKAISGS